MTEIANVDTVVAPTPDVWAADNIIPFTRDHEKMLKEVHEFLFELKATIEQLSPMVTPLLAGLGIDLS